MTSRPSHNLVVAFLWVGIEREERSPATAVDVTRQITNAIERERYDPSIELAFKLAAHFDCRIEDLFEPELDGVMQDGEG